MSADTNSSEASLRPESRGMGNETGQHRRPLADQLDARERPAGFSNLFL